VPEREEQHVDDDRQNDDRPAVVADVLVDRFQRLEQRRHDQPEHAEVDRADQFLVCHLQLVEVLRAQVERHLHGLARRGAWIGLHGEGNERALHVRPAGHGQRDGSVFHFRARGGLRQRGNDEIMLFDAGKTHRALIGRLRGHGCRLQGV
jgi:hypothetical protein